LHALEVKVDRLVKRVRALRMGIARLEAWERVGRRVG
jgi:hypothetical protein